MNNQEQAEFDKLMRRMHKHGDSAERYIWDAAIEFAENRRATLPEAGGDKGEPVAWAKETPYGRGYSFADELLASMGVECPQCRVKGDTFACMRCGAQSHAITPTPAAPEAEALAGIIRTVDGYRAYAEAEGNKSDAGDLARAAALLRQLGQGGEAVGYVNVHEFNGKNDGFIAHRLKSDFFTIPVYTRPAPVAVTPVALAMLRRIREWGFSGPVWSAMRAPTVEEVDAAIAASEAGPVAVTGEDAMHDIVKRALDTHMPNGKWLTGPNTLAMEIASELEAALEVRNGL